MYGATNIPLGGSVVYPIIGGLAGYRYDRQEKINNAVRDLIEYTINNQRQANVMEDLDKKMKNSEDAAKNESVEMKAMIETKKWMNKNKMLAQKLESYLKNSQ